MLATAVMMQHSVQKSVKMTLPWGKHWLGGGHRQGSIGGRSGKRIGSKSACRGRFVYVQYLSDKLLNRLLRAFGVLDR